MYFIQDLGYYNRARYHLSTDFIRTGVIQEYESLNDIPNSFDREHLLWMKKNNIKVTQNGSVLYRIE